MHSNVFEAFQAREQHGVIYILKRFTLAVMWKMILGDGRTELSQKQLQALNVCVGGGQRGAKGEGSEVKPF